MNEWRQSMELIPAEKAVPGSSPGHRLRALSSLASVESLSMPLVQEVVLSADIGCAECRKRIADVMSRMNGVESMTVSVREKKVTLSCKYSYPANVAAPERQVPAIHKKSFSKTALIKRIFRGN